MPKASTARPYHHGNVHGEVLAKALEVIAAEGASALSLRDVARRVGVSHGAAAHHFGDKAGLLTVIATEGYRLLGEHLAAAAATGDFGKVGVAYVRFAVAHPAHFEVMFRPDVYHRHDPAIVQARERTAALLYGSAARVADAVGGDEVLAGTAAWAYVHGIATLWRDGNLRDRFADPVALAEEIGPFLFQASAVARPRFRRR